MRAIARSIAESLGPNGLPYRLPIHPNLVHFTIGLFVIAIVRSMMLLAVVLARSI